MAPGLSCFPSASQPLPSVPGIAYKTLISWVSEPSTLLLTNRSTARANRWLAPVAVSEQAVSAEATGPEQAAPKSQRHA
jgi:hypothetical protein